MHLQEDNNKSLKYELINNLVFPKGNMLPDGIPLNKLLFYLFGETHLIAANELVQ